MPVIKASIQDKVDEYISLHKHVAELNAELKKLRKDIEPYMQTRELDEIEGSEGGKVYYTNTERVTASARFQTYDPIGLAEVLSVDHYNECIREVIDADKLNLLVKDGHVGKSVAEKYKMTYNSTSFKVAYK
jgi:hypothetical protein